MDDSPDRRAGPWLLVSVALLAGCASPPGHDQAAPFLRYVGSSTIGNFIDDAAAVYAPARLVADTEPESAGGERAIGAGRADLAGVAGPPRPETIGEGVKATLIGRDAIAVVVNPVNPITGLSRRQLEGIFTGRTANWKALGGPDLAIHPLIVGPESATRAVFRSAVLGAEAYAGCAVVRPDRAIPAQVAADPGAIGQISFSFLTTNKAVKALAVDGEAPRPENRNYPITRPLYLLWWPGRARVAAFIDWTKTQEALALLRKRFAAPGEAR